MALCDCSSLSSVYVARAALIWKYNFHFTHGWSCFFLFELLNCPLIKCNLSSKIIHTSSKPLNMYMLNRIHPCGHADINEVTNVLKIKGMYK